MTLWRDRFLANGLDGLDDASRSGRPKVVDDAAILAATLEPPPDKLAVTHWSTRLLAGELGVGDATVARAWRRYGIKPWRRETFKFSTDPQLEAKVRDVVGLYLNPPQKAVVLCVDEKSQIQALDRTAPILPLRLEGVSMMATLRDGGAPETHTVQYFEMFGNRGIYHNGWTAVTKHRTPWLADQPALDDDVWELYGPDDWSQAHNVAGENPQKLAELQRLWLIEAVKYNVVPLDDRSFERFDADIAGRPKLISGTSQLLFSGMRVSENCVVNVKNKSHSVTAELNVPESGAAGVIVTQGGGVGGWSLYAHQGRLKYCYNFFGIEYYFVTADERIPAGKRQVRMEFAYDGGGMAKGGNVTLYYDGKAVGTGRVEQTEPMAFSADEACDVGSDTGSPASPDYGPTGNKFSGQIHWVRLDIGKDSHDHLITAEDKLNIAMSRQ